MTLKASSTHDASLGRVSESTPPQGAPKEFWTSLDIAEAIGSSRDYVLDAIKQNGKNPPPRLDAVQLEDNGPYFITPKDAQAFIEQHLRPVSNTDLSGWLTGSYGEGWVAVEQAVKWRYSFRSAPRPEQSVSRAKKIRVGKRQVAIVVTLVQQTQEPPKYEARLRVSPVGRAINVPVGMKIRGVLHESGVESARVAGEEQRFLQIEVVDLEPGEPFDLEVSYGRVTFTEKFTL